MILTILVVSPIIRCSMLSIVILFFFFQAEDGIRDVAVTGVQTCALPILPWWTGSRLFQEVTVQIPEQATSQHFGSPAAYTSILSRRTSPSENYAQTII